MLKIATSANFKPPSPSSPHVPQRLHPLSVNAFLESESEEKVPMYELNQPLSENISYKR